MDDLKNHSKLCMDIFYNDALRDFVNSTFYLKNGNIKDFHLPILFGDDCTYTNATYNF